MKRGLVLWFKEIGKDDIPLVGGKCANLGELIGKIGVPVPNGFAVTANAYKVFLDKTNAGKTIESLLSKMDINDMITDVKRGILVTNNWYTRFQNMRTGEFSTIPRDATFLIENGSIKHPIRGTRISDSLPRLLMNIQSISKERKWIEWWEVSVPTLSPSMHIKDVSISKALGT